MKNGGKKVHSRKETSQTKTAVILTGATILLVATVSIMTHSLGLATPVASSTIENQSLSDSSNKYYRTLDENDGGGYSNYICDDIFLYTQADSEERCEFAQSCNQGLGLFANFIFCGTFGLSLQTWCYILTPFFTIALVLLFRMLGSTAEDFFSPSLEMFSIKMGLPPRFAGVTLLALGNGAADVSATISAIAQNPDEGYLMSLGALTGAGMFVGTVVAGIVIVTAGGVKCRGALVRDLCMFLITLVMVYLFFDSGEIGPAAINTFFWSYFSFVVVVLIADIYHRQVVLPRIQRKNEILAHTPVEGREGAAEHLDEDEEEETFFTPTNTAELEMPSASGSIAEGGTEPSPLAVKFSPDDVASSLQQKKTKRSKLRVGFDKVMVAMSNYGANEGKAYMGKSQRLNGWGGGLELVDDGEEDLIDEPIRLHGANGLLTRQSSTRDEATVIEAEQNNFDPAQSYKMMMEGVDNMCTIEDSTSTGMETTWKKSLNEAFADLKDHFGEYWNDIWENEENNAFDKFFLLVELPFTAMRMLTVTITSDDYYCRALVGLSTALAPVWVGIYLYSLQGSDFFASSGFAFIEMVTIVGFLGCILIIRFAPALGSDMNLSVSVPLALVGFIIAATWIDAIATQLVKLLTLLGVICRIPGSIMGLTILAWGNSMGDLSANLTMAKKGLANMAITACFAGPVFNILIGLGGGFLKLNSMTGNEITEVEMTTSVSIGFCFLAVNCVLVMVAGLVVNSGVIPKAYGYVAVALYVIYVVTCVGQYIYHAQAE